MLKHSSISRETFNTVVLKLFGPKASLKIFFSFVVLISLSSGYMYDTFYYYIQQFSFLYPSLRYEVTKTSTSPSNFSPTRDADLPVLIYFPRDM